MTGYGKAVYEDNVRCISVEVKSINAKYADITLRLPKECSEQEITWKNKVVSLLQRGKITLSLSYTRKDTTLSSAPVDPARFKAYYQILQTLAEEVGAPSSSLFQLALQLPGVLVKTAPTLDDKEDVQVLESVLQAALRQCEDSRKREGTTLHDALLTYLADIEQGLAYVRQLGPVRHEVRKKKLQEHVTQHMDGHPLDPNRLMQEMIYYVERLDFTEEQVRLAQHLAYFREVMKGPTSEGKKLGFLAQEIGREINTIGSKAHDATIQQEVVHMKDALEKIKEQLLNVL
jgi:uncharacterized protein (TIGR00255 family)